MRGDDRGAGCSECVDREARGREAAARLRPESRGGFALADIRLPEIEIKSIDPKVIPAPGGQRAPIRLVADRPDLQIIWFNDNNGGIQ